MSGIILPNDRTNKQPIFAYCTNPECRVKGEEYRFTINDDYFACPKCGACEPPMVGAVVLIHWLRRDPKGPLKGAGGLRYVLACDPGREYLATVTNLEAASGDSSVVNCPGCLHQASLHKSPNQGSPILTGDR